jgi:hypothetical protein
LRVIDGLPTSRQGVQVRAQSERVVERRASPARNGKR